MAYPNEVSRAEKNTGTTAYTELTLSIGGDAALVAIPAGIADGAPVTVVVCAHGHNGTEQTINGVMVDTTRRMLNEGWIVASAYAHGNAWANESALDAYRALWQWVGAHWAVHHTLLHGQSMGGLTMAVAYARGTFGKVRGMVGIDSAMNLAQAFSQTAYRPSIRTAYGIATDGSDYATKTAGHDAVLLPPARFHGKRLFLSSSPNDTAIPKAEHTDLFVSRITGYPAALETRTGTGTHVSTANYFPADVMTFYREAITYAPAVEWPEPEPLPDGVTKVDLYMLINGAAVQLTPTA